MVSRPEDRPKAILLVVAIVAVLAFVVWNLRKALSANDVVAQPVAPQPGNTLVPPANLGNNVAGQPDGGYYAQFQPSTSMSDPAQVDPFRSPLPRMGNIQNIGEGSNNSSSPNGNGGGLQSVDRGPGILSVNQIESSIQLKGIVSGAGAAMAVLKIGETTFNLFAGERITKDLWVTRITPTMCELSYFKMPIRLVIGQAKMASVAVPKPKGSTRGGLVAEPAHLSQPVEVVPNISELPESPRNTTARNEDTKPAYVPPPTPREEPKREPKPEPRPEPKQEPRSIPNTPVNTSPPRTEPKPTEPTTSQPTKPAPMGPI